MNRKRDATECVDRGLWHGQGCIRYGIGSERSYDADLGAHREAQVKIFSHIVEIRKSIESMSNGKTVECASRYRWCAKLSRLRSYRDH